MLGIYLKALVELKAMQLNQGFIHQ